MKGESATGQGTERNGATKRTFFPYYSFSLCLFHQMYRKQDFSFQKFQEGLGVNWNF